MDQRLDLLGELGAELVEEGIYGIGGQLFGWTASDAIDVVLGCHLGGKPVCSTDLSEVFCLTKPVAATGVLLALEGAGIAPDVPIGDLVGSVATLPPDVTVSSIINHAARLKEPSALSWMLTRAAKRPPLHEIVQDQSAPRAYSEISGWRLLLEVVTAVTGCEAGDWIRRSVAEPLGVGDAMCLTAAGVEAAVAADRVLVPVGGLPGAPVPMLHLQAPGYRRRMDLALGGMASARAIGELTASLADATQGVGCEGMPTTATLASVVEAAPPAAFDGTWRRQTAFALGYELVPATRSDGSQAELWVLGSFMTPALVVADPGRGTGCCLILNGTCMDPADLRWLQGRCLLNLGYRLRERLEGDGDVVG